MSVISVSIPLDALISGGIHLRAERVADVCGYLDIPGRAIVVNPDATEEQLSAEIDRGMATFAKLRELERARPDRPPIPAPRLVHSVTEPEEPADDDAQPFGPQVVG